MNRRSILIAAGGAGLILPGLSAVAFAQTGGGDAARSPVSSIAAAGTASLQASQLAAQKARSPTLRQFAELEVEEQQNLLKAMKAAGDDPGRIEPPAAKKAAFQRLQQARDAEFDRLYLQDQLAGHQELLQLNQSHLQQAGSNAAKTVVPLLAIPAIKSHIAMLQMIQQDTTASGSSSAQ